MHTQQRFTGLRACCHAENHHNMCPRCGATAAVVILYTSKDLRTWQRADVGMVNAVDGAPRGNASSTQKHYSGGP